MLQDTRNLIYIIQARINELNEAINKQAYYLEKIILDKEELEDILINYSEYNFNDIIKSVRTITQLLKLENHKVDKTYINELIAYINDRINKVKNDITRKQFYISKNKDVLDLFDIKTCKLKYPITSLTQFETITNDLAYSEITSNLTINMILQELNRQNLEALKEREKQRRKNTILEKSKLMVREKLKSKKDKIKEEIYEVNEEVLLSKEEKRTLDLAKQIINKNNHIITEGFNSEIIEAHDIGIIEDINPVELFTKENDQLNMTLKEIIYYYNEYNKTQNQQLISTLSSYLKLYNDIKLKINLKDQEQEKIKQLEKNNKELFDKIESNIKIFDKTMTEDDLNRLESIKLYLTTITEVDEQFKVEDYVNSIATGSNITIDNCNQLLLLKSIKEKYYEYLKMTSYNDKKDLIEYLNNTLKEYIDMIETTKIINQKNSSEKNNILLFLPVDNITGIEDFYQKNRTETTNEKQKIENFINDLYESDRNTIFTRSEKVKKNGSISEGYNERVRRIRRGDMRIAYFDINAFENMNLNLEKDCYVVITCGTKAGQTGIYDYVNSKKIRDQVKQFLNEIKANIESIRSLPLSREEIDRQVEIYTNDLINTNNSIYNDFVGRDKKQNIKVGEVKHV